MDLPGHNKQVRALDGFSVANVVQRLPTLLTLVQRLHYDIEWIRPYLPVSTIELDPSAKRHECCHSCPGVGRI